MNIIYILDFNPILVLFKLIPILRAENVTCEFQSYISLIQAIFHDLVILLTQK